MRNLTQLETVFVIVPVHAVPMYETAFADACTAVGMFIHDEDAGLWRVEGVKPVGESPQLRAGLAMAELASGATAPLQRTDTAADGWLARVYDGFPEQIIGQRFAVRGSHIAHPPQPGRITLKLDAGLAFGSGEHGSTRGCLRALQSVARRRIIRAPGTRILDMGAGSGILAMAAAKIFHRPVLAVDIDPLSVLVCRQNAKLNHIAPALRAQHGNGWAARAVRGGKKFDLVFANILARPLCLMARDLAAQLAPNGTAILAGLLTTQLNMVRIAHRRHGLHVAQVVHEGPWSTLVLHRRASQASG